MRARNMATAAAAVATVATIATLAAVVERGTTQPPPPPQRDGHVQVFWPGGGMKTDATYRHDAYEGEYRSYYESGAPYEVRHYADGREQGLQQSWSEDGTPYLNYEVREGRRFGLVNASPCTPVETAESGIGPAPAGLATPTVAAPAATGAPGVQSPDAQGRASLPYYADASFTPRWSPVAHQVAPFHLTTQTGDAISSAGLSGHPYVASFIYTQCAAVCPILVQHLARVQRAAPSGTRLVSFTVTPDTDTPNVLAAFGRERGIDARTWSLVTGDKRTIYTLARTSFFADDSRVGTAPDDATAFLHSEKLLLVDAAGHLRGVYNGTQPHAIDQLIGDLATLTSTAGSGL